MKENNVCLIKRIRMVQRASFPYDPLATRAIIPPSYCVRLLCSLTLTQ